jgi:hypothetical protein
MLAQPAIAQSRTRKWTLAVVLWAFGLATTTLLVGLWGRSITNDQSTLEASARTVLGADVVTERVNDWLTDAVAATAGMSGQDLGEALQTVAASPEADRAVDQIVEDIVLAALAPPGTEVSIQIASALQPLVPLVAAEAEAYGVDVPIADVTEAINRASTVVLSTEAASEVSSAAYRARSVLTTVVVVGLAALVLFGSSAIALADDHIAMVRSLGIRLAVSAMTFAVFLRLGAWATDPGQGQSPLVSGGSVLLGSNHLVLFVVAAAALAVALAAGSLVRRRRLATRAAATPSHRDDPTAERVLVNV